YPLRTAEHGGVNPALDSQCIGEMEIGPVTNPHVSARTIEIERLPDNTIAEGHSSVQCPRIRIANIIGVSFPRPPTVQAGRHRRTIRRWWRRRTLASAARIVNRHDFACR